MTDTITKKKIESLGFNFLDVTEKLEIEYTFEKLIKEPKHYCFLVWKPKSGEIMISESKIQDRKGTYKIKKLYIGNPKTLNELKEILQ